MHAASASRENVHGALIALAAGACAIGFAPLFVRLSPVDPTATGFWRLALSLPFLIVLRLILLSDRLRYPVSRVLPLFSLPSKPHLAPAVPLTRSDEQSAENISPTPEAPARGSARYAWLLLPGFFFAGDLAVWHWSIHFTTVANATLLTNFAPIFVTIIAYFYFGERFDGRFPVGLLLAMTGAILLISRSVQISPDHLFGDLLGVATALFYAAYQLSVKRLRRDFSTLTLMFGASFTGAVLLLALAIMNGETILPAVASGKVPTIASGGEFSLFALAITWSPLVGLALVSHIAGQGLIAYAFAHLSASFSSVSLLIQPIVAAIGAYFLFGEALGPVELLGAGVVLSGVILARLATRSS